MISNIRQTLFQNYFDHWLAITLAAHRSTAGIEIFKIISYFGNWELLVPVIFIIIYILYIKQKRRFIIPFILTLVGAEITTYLVKLLFNRPRPVQAILMETDPSFPSGHATIAVTFYGYIVYMLIKSLPGKYQKPIILTTALIMILIGFSRLYLGVHYFSDVLAGYLVGLIFLAIGINFTNRLTIKK